VDVPVPHLRVLEDILDVVDIAVEEQIAPVGRGGRFEIDRSSSTAILPQRVAMGT
jgi:hypothetical protein